MNYSRRNINPVVELSLALRFRSTQARYYLIWFLVDVVVLSFFVLDMWLACPGFYRTYFFQAERTFTVGVGLSAVACFVKYLWLRSGCDQVMGTESQKRLLDGDDDNSISTVDTRPAMKPDTEAKDEGPIINWHSSFEHSDWGTQSLRHRPSNLTSGESTYRSPYKYPYRSPYAMPEDFITDPRKLPAMIQQAERERELSMLDNTEAATVRSMGSANMTYMLRTTVYQLSPAPEVYTEKAPSSFEEFGGFQFKESNSEVIKRLSLDQRSRYVANLRLWISTTILKRLVQEITYAEDVFRQCGLSDLQFGAVSVERLRKYAENLQFVQTYVPHLPMVLAFLDSFSNQEYVVQRIKELSEGSVISDFRWNSGSVHYGREWTEQLPTDTAILFDLICVYLDSQLMPLPQNAGRPFYSRYVQIHDGKRSTKDIVSAVHNKAGCAILSTSNPLNPKLNFMSGGKLHNCVYNRNNLFYVIIEFLIYMRQHQESALEGLNLGKIGVNIMYVIEDEENPAFM